MTTTIIAVARKGRKMKVTIEGTKAEIIEILAEIRRRDKEYITVPWYPTYPYKTTWADTTPIITCSENEQKSNTITAKPATGTSTITTKCNIPEYCSWSKTYENMVQGIIADSRHKEGGTE